MLPNKKLTAQFNKFVGRVVTVTETPRSIEVGGRTYNTASHAIAKGDKLLGQLREAARKAGFSLRVWLPGTRGTMDYRPSRLNVTLKKEKDGKFRIQDNIRFG
jgi:hypothetical protein